MVTTGTPQALELREAPYPYSKMCELCELCELLERNPTALRWDLLISTQQNLFVAFDFWNARRAIGTAAGFWNARSAIGTPQAIGTRLSAFPLTLKCVNFVNFVNFWKEKSHRFCDGIFFIYPQQNLFVGRGIFRRWLLSCIFMSRVRLCFGRVVRLLQRAEESCEGLKHGYYDLPCVHFLIFLCHSFKRTKFCKIKQNFSFLKPSGTRAAQFE